MISIKDKHVLTLFIGFKIEMLKLLDDFYEGFFTPFGTMIITSSVLLLKLHTRGKV